jgi:hypothetical protein
MQQCFHIQRPYRPQETLNTQTYEATMIILSAVRDFADGLSRGFSLFFTERHDTTARHMLPPDKPVRR